MTGCKAPRYPAPAILIESYYRGYRIEVNAVPIDGRWNAVVRIRRVVSEDKPHVETVTCR